jgi:hypothetical protein
MRPSIPCKKRPPGGIKTNNFRDMPGGLFLLLREGKSENPTHSLSPQNQGATPKVLLALLLLALPSLFTLQKLVMLAA